MCTDMCNCLTADFADFRLAIAEGLHSSTGTLTSLTVCSYRVLEPIDVSTHCPNDYRAASGYC